MDKLILHDIRLTTKLGLYQWEQQKVQTLLLNLDLGIDNDAKQSDAIDDTIDYAQLIYRLNDHYKDKSFNLIEALAENIADYLLENYNIIWLKLALFKPGVLLEVKTVGIEIEREKKEA